MPFEASSNWPQRTIIDDTAMATIPYQDYLDLRAYRLMVEELKARGLVNEDNSLGLFSHDAEVAIYLAVRFGLMTAREVMADIERRFGEERKPTAVEVKRFWLRFQKCFLPRENQAAK